MSETFTHKDLAKLCGVSETTIKSYRRKFPGFIPVLTRGKPIRFKGEASDVCLKIRECFDKGMSVNETRKVLKKNFKELAPDTPGRTHSASGPGPTVSQEYMEKFFKTAGQMMQGMAGLATAQAKTGQRLDKVEKSLDRLVELETRNNETFALLLKQLQSQPVDFSSPSAQSKAAAPGPAKKVRARKIVNVRSPEGNINSYAIEKDRKDTDMLDHPSDDFLNTPIVIRNSMGEFLGVPGRLPLSGFINILIREAEESGSSLSHWDRRGDAWVFTMKTPDSDSHELFFSSTTTPKGNLVVLLDRLDVNQKKTSTQFLQEFFRQVKDKI